MKILPLFKRHSAAESAGNPANPSLKEREKIIAKNKNKSEPVKKLPAHELRHD